MRWKKGQQFSQELDTCFKINAVCKENDSRLSRMSKDMGMVMSALLFVVNSKDCRLASGTVY